MEFADLLEEWDVGTTAVLLVVGVLSVLLWRVPVIGWLFYPFRLLLVFVHELGHWLATLFMGGTVERIEVYPNRTGKTTSLVRNQSCLLVIAGYLSVPLFGLLLFGLAVSGVASQEILLSLGAGLLLLSLFFVRNSFGLLSGIVLSALLIWAGASLDDFWASRLLFLLAVQMIFGGLLSVYEFGWNNTSDAGQLARLTGIPRTVWTLLWTAVAVVVILLSLRLAQDGLAVLLPG